MPTNLTKQTYLPYCICIYLKTKSIPIFSVQQVQTDWTPWTRNESNPRIIERYRFTCKANVTDKKYITTELAGSDMKFCTDGKTFDKCATEGEIQNNKVDNKKIDRLLRRYCKKKGQLHRKYNKCRRLGIFMICQKSGYG